MRIFTFCFFFSVLSFSAFSQQNNEVKKLVEEGIQLRNKGDYSGSIKKYDEALALNKDDFDALYEKSFSYISAKRTDEGVALCKTLIEKFPRHTLLRQIYTNWANAV